MIMIISHLSPTRQFFPGEAAAPGFFHFFGGGVGATWCYLVLLGDTDLDRTGLILVGRVAPRAPPRRKKWLDLVGFGRIRLSLGSTPTVQVGMARCAVRLRARSCLRRASPPAGNAAVSGASLPRTFSL
jgi:hypothetical protein